MPKKINTELPRSFPKKLAIGAKKSVRIPPSLLPTSTILAASLLRASELVSVDRLISEYFLEPSSIIALTNACLRSKLVKLETAFPVLAA